MSSLEALYICSCFAKIVGEYEQRAVYKRYNVVDNGSDFVLETFGVIYRFN